MNYTQKLDLDPGLPSHYLQFFVHFHCREIMELKATAWRGVLIAQFEDYFDAAL